LVHLTVSSRIWTVGGVEAASGDTLPVGTHDVCLLVTVTNKTCGKVTINVVLIYFAPVIVQQKII
jgi:hypothetical protein